LFVGLFSVFSFVAIVVALPLAFYQGTIAGVIAPAAAAPGWLAWVAGILPLDDLMFGMRAILIGGPDGAVPLGAVFVLLLVGLALIWGGTTAHAMRGAKSEAAA
jgi:ABC-type multidrug transport system permease subunit